MSQQWSLPSESLEGEDTTESASRGGRGVVLALWSTPPERRRSTAVKLEPRLARLACGWATAGRLGYAMEVELGRDEGDSRADEEVGE